MESKDFYGKILKIATIFGLLFVIVIGFDKMRTIFDTILTAFMPFIVGGLMAVILNIPVRFFENTLFKKDGKIINKIKRPISILISLALFALLLTGIGFIVVPEIAEAISEMSTTIPSAIREGILLIESTIELKPEIVAELDKVLEATKSWELLVAYVSGMLPNVTDQLGDAVVAVKDVIGTLTNVLIAFIFAMYALGQKEGILSCANKCAKIFLPEKKYNSLSHFMVVLHKSFEDFIYGQCLECFLVALIFTITSSILGFKCSIIIGIAMFFLAFIPYVGNFVACGAGMLLTLAMESPGRALAICVLFCVIQALDGYFLYPRVIGLKVNMPPLLIFVAVIAGGNLFGVAGVFLSIPVVTAIYTIIKEKIEHHEKEHGIVELHQEMKCGIKPVPNTKAKTNNKNKKTRR